MSSGSGAWGMRRLVPPPRRRPSLLQIAVRWRVELFLLAVVAVLWQLAGPEPLGWAVLVIAVAAMAVRPVRRTLLGLVQATVAAHRVRSGLVQAGIAERSGRLPWIVAARPRGDAVLVSIWLISGTAIDDVRDAAGVLATSCGATRVDVLQRSPRQDRAVLAVIQPRWGWPTR
jgi:hypothetical protein